MLVDLLLFVGKVEVLIIGLFYYSFDYFMEVEVMKLVGELLVFLDMFSVYLIVGIYSFFMIYYLILVILLVLYLEFINEIFLGFLFELDVLLIIYELIFD